MAELAGGCDDEARLCELFEGVVALFAAGGGRAGLFAAYRFPPPTGDSVGELRWYFRPQGGGPILEGPEAVAPLVRCEFGTPRVAVAGPDELKTARREIETLKVARHLRDIQAGQGAKATLVCWMEVC